MNETDMNRLIVILLIVLALLVLMLFVLFLLERKRNHTEQERLYAELKESESELKLQQSDIYTQLLTRLDRQDMTGQQNTENLRSSLLQQMNYTSDSTEKRLETIRGVLDEKMNQLDTKTAQKLEDIRYLVDQKLQENLDQRLSQSFRLVSEQLNKVHEGLGEMQNLSGGINDLKKVLNNTKTRGILGEIQLGNILSDILSPAQYEENIPTVNGSTERVEYAIKLPAADDSFVYLPIDAKFPVEAYLRLSEAAEEGDKEKADAARKELVQVFRTQAKRIASKYVHIPETTEFAVMFLPTEGLYATACELGLNEILQRDYRVSICGPSTMAALLNSLQMGFRSLAIQERSSEVWQLLGSVRSEFAKFEETLNNVQKRLDQTSQELNDLVGVRTRSINRRLRELESGEITENGNAELE